MLAPNNNSLNGNVSDDLLRIDEGIQGVLHEFGANTSYSLVVPERSFVLLACTEGKISYHNSEIPRTLCLEENEGAMPVFPHKPWNLMISGKNSKVAIFIVSLMTLHKLLDVSSYDDSKSFKFDYKAIPSLIPFKATLAIKMSQIFDNRQAQTFDHLLKKAKFLEVFSHYIEYAYGKMSAQCPFVMSQEIELKISHVRRNITQNLVDVPDVQALSHKFSLPKTTLIKGFKYLYGTTPHTFYQNYRMDKAKALLQSGNFLVKEVAYEVGYSNTSHFIDTFRKKYGSTPKQYLKAL